MHRRWSNRDYLHLSPEVGGGFGGAGAFACQPAATGVAGESACPTTLAYARGAVLETRTRSGLRRRNIRLIAIRATPIVANVAGSGAGAWNVWSEPVTWTITSWAPTLSRAYRLVSLGPFPSSDER